ncbi:MAG: ABC transporter permease [Anaerolineales bacterium]|nr:ABC transporter permease [Anaerolineales bacterium]
MTVDILRRLCRNRAAIFSAVIIVVNVLVALLAPYLAPASFDAATLADSNAAPSWVTKAFTGMKPQGEGGYVKINDNYLLGTDKLGRDLLSRIMYGARISMAVAIMGPLISIAIGFVVGLVAGYQGGRTDNLLMRFVDVMYAFPTYLLIILLMAFFRAGFNQQDSGTLAYALSKLDAALGGLLFIFIGIGLTAWMGAARLVRGQVLSVRQNEYILAAQALGATTPRIILRHIFPNIIGPLIITETMSIPGYISYEAFLSFIGLGVNPPTPSWGGMIADGAQVIQSYPNQALFPALALFLLMFAFNFFGDGLRDAFDPTLQGRE